MGPMLSAVFLFLVNVIGIFLGYTFLLQKIMVIQ